MMWYCMFWCFIVGLPHTHTHPHRSNSEHDQLAIAYHLLLDNRALDRATQKLLSSDQHLATSPPQQSFLDSFDGIKETPKKPVSMCIQYPLNIRQTVHSLLLDFLNSGQTLYVYNILNSIHL